MNGAAEVRMKTKLRLVIEEIGCFSLSCPLAISAIYHVQAPFATIKSISRYNLVSGDVNLVVASLLPVLQILAVCGLYARSHRLLATWLCTMLYTVFVFAQFSAIVRGLSIECGCFGSASSTITWSSAISVLGLLVISGGMLCLERNFSPKRD